jgi:hypothetical protein
MPSPDYEQKLDIINEQINGLSKNALEATRHGYRSEMRNLALLKAIVGEIIYADPDAKIRMAARLDLYLLHCDEEDACAGIKQAVTILSST